MSTVTVRVDEQTKQNATAVLSDIGLDISTAVRMFLRQVVLRGQMPIELMQDSFYSHSNQAALRESIKQLEDGRIVTKTLDELQSF
ncbi:MAG: type II toxin-antitoxin system RelB/DinJ family antitoxin [Propionibacteriaceae bacterium]|nr:type II toxin-antitoxin system RelB/DinJ family antitoxin [Propionibacteriaceae bacterium]